MGLVYRVHHRGWNIDLAVKTPRLKLVSSPQRMSGLDHPRPPLKAPRLRIERYLCGEAFTDSPIIGAATR
jgi:hypothetical protein